jgi:hypothetical protein
VKISIHRTALVVTAVSALVGFSPLSPGWRLQLTSVRLKLWNMRGKPDGLYLTAGMTCLTADN